MARDLTVHLPENTIRNRIFDHDGNFIYTGDFATSVAVGEIPGWAVLRALGERKSMGTTVQGEDIWRGNELSPAPTSHTSIPMPDSAGEQMTVVSEHANDTSGGVGVKTLRLEYLDATGAEQTEDIIMNGTTGVNTVATDIRFINDMYSLTVGTNGVAVGHIKIYKTGSVGLVYNMIVLGGNKSLVPHRMVPVGKTLVIRQWHATEAQSKRIAFRLRSTDMNGVLIPGVFCFKDVIYLKQDSLGAEINVKVPALSVVKVSGWAVVGGAETSCSWWGYLIND